MNKDFQPEQTWKTCLASLYFKVMMTRISESVLNGIKSLGFFIIFFLVAAAGAESHSGTAQKHCNFNGILTAERPNAGGSPTVVSVGVWMFNLSEINAVEQSLTGDFLVALTWTDPRLAEFAGCEVPLASVWSPHVYFRDAGHLFRRGPDMVRVGPNGKVRYLQRYRGTMPAIHDLKDFPLDEHRLHVLLASFQYGEGQVRFALDQRMTGINGDLLSIPDWRIIGVKGSIDRIFVKPFDRFHSVFDFEISVQREIGYYLWKVIIPLCLIVFMSWAVFWINPVQFGPQIGLSATSMLTLIAFQFATKDILPKIPYFTILDRFIFGSTILVFVALLQSISTTFFVSRKKIDLALRIDALCRVAFPVAFALMLAFIFFH